MIKQASIAIQAKTIIPLHDEHAARGSRLFSALKKIDNGLLIIKNGIIEDVTHFKNSHLPLNTKVHDIGAVTLIPACINAHTHIQLSCFKNKTTFGKGFTEWLKSMIHCLHTINIDEAKESIIDACEFLSSTGTLHIADIHGSFKGGLKEINDICKTLNLGISHFCEWFGFENKFTQNNSIYPDNCSIDAEKIDNFFKYASPSVHSLYSTDPIIIKKIREYCRVNKKIFNFHLAESKEETEMLTTGSGKLYDLFKNTILPDNWIAPNMRPLAYATSLNLLGAGSLAIHGCQLNAQEIEVLSASGTSLCLCPRSNRNIGVGIPPIRSLMENSVLLCLGTDGLSSNTDLDVRNEAVYLRESFDIPPEALIRMLTINGAQALNLPNGSATLRQGSPAKFCILPDTLTY